MQKRLVCHICPKRSRGSSAQAMPAEPSAHVAQLRWQFLGSFHAAASTADFEIFYGLATPPTSYGGYGGKSQNAKEDGAHAFHMPVDQRSPAAAFACLTAFEHPARQLLPHSCMQARCERFACAHPSQPVSHGAS